MRRRPGVVAVVTSVALVFPLLPIPTFAAATPARQPVAAASNTASPSPSSTSSASPTALNSQAPSPPPSASPTATPAPTKTPSPAPGPSAAAASPSPAASPTPSTAASSTPTASPKPTSTPPAPRARTAPPAAPTTSSGAVLADSPLVYYRLDESACCTAADSSGNARSGTYAGTGITYGVAGLLTGDANTAISTSGAGAAVARDPAFLPSSGARTVEVWEQTTATNSQALLSYGQTNANIQYFQLSIRPSGSGTALVFIGWGDDAAFATPYPVNDGHPHHVALAYDGAGVVTFYLDGQQIGQAGLAAALNTALGAQSLQIGSGVDGPFTGILDEVAIYGAELSPGQVNAHWRAGTAAAACPAPPATGYAGAVSADHPYRYFRFGDTGQAATDYSANCRYAAYAPGAPRVPGLLTGDTDRAVANPTPVTTIVNASADGLPSSGPRTVELWEQTTATNSQSLLSYGRTNANIQYFQLSIRPDGSGTALVFIGWGDDAAFATPYPINDGVPHHVALSYDSAVVTFYIDGQQIGQAGLAAALNTSVGSQGLEIGNGVDGPFTGILDEAAVYSTALTPAQVNAHWRAGAAGAACPATPTIGYAKAVAADHPYRHFRLGDAGQAATDYSSNCQYAAYAPGAVRVPGLLSNDADRAVANPTPPTTIVNASAAGLPSSGPRTVELWEQTTSGNNQALLSYGQTNANIQYFQLSIRPGGGSTALVFTGWGDDAAFVTPYSINDGTPHHIALTYDTAIVTFFVDGQQIGQAGLAAALNTSVGAQGLEIGNGVDGAFVGTLDEAAVYLTALTPAQVNSHWRAGAAALACPTTAPGGYAPAVLADQPLRYFRLGDATGQAATDYSAGCRYAAYAPGAPRVAGLLSGDNDGAAANPTPLTTIVNASADGLPSSGPRTVEIWEQTTATGNQALLSYGRTNANIQYFQLSIRPNPGGTALVFIGWGDDAAFMTPYSINDGKPHHVALAYDGAGVVTFYLDGQQIGQAGLAAALVTSVGSQGLEIGNGVDGPFTGTLDEAAVYATALSPAQVNAHWRAGAAGAPCPAPPTTGYAGAVAADHPFRHFRLGDPNGQAAADHSGNCQYAAYAPGVVRMPGLLSNDGDRAVANPTPPTTIVNASAAGLPADGPRTVELWEQTTSLSNQALLSYGRTNANIQYFQLSIRPSGNSTALVFTGWGDDAAFLTPYPINDGNPHHVALSYDAAVVTFYVDGQQIGQAGLAAALITSVGSQGLEIGDGNDGPFTGTLDEAAVYLTALTPAQVNAHWRAGAAGAACPAIPTTGFAGAVASERPIDYFRLGDTTGQAATDYSGNCRYAAYAPGVPRVAGLLFGDPDGAVASSTPATTIVSASADGLPTTGPRSVELWEQTSATNSQALLSYGRTNANIQYFQLSIRPSGTGTALVFVGWGDDAAFATPYPINDGAPHHIVLTYDGAGVVAFYVDGLLLGQAGLPAALNTSVGSQGLEIGSGVDGPFTGTLDEVAFYGSALSPTRITGHYLRALQKLPAGLIIGRVTYTPAGGSPTAVAGASVTATTCLSFGTGCTSRTTTTGPDGGYRLGGLAFGAYGLSVFPGVIASTVALQPGYASAHPTPVDPAAVADVSLAVVPPMPPTVTFNGTSGASSVFWGSPTAVTVQGCANGIGLLVTTALSQTSSRRDVRAVPLLETPPGSGNYVGNIPPFYPDHGNATAQVFLRCPTPTAVLPGDGPATGGTAVTIRGQGFTGTTAVFFGSTPALSFQVVNDTTIIAVAPPGTGTVQISLTGPYGTIGCSSLLQFTYLSVTGVSPSFGPTAGRAEVTITGTGFLHMAGVYFGAVKAPLAVALSDTEIVAMTPPGTGTVDVRVVTAGGASPATTADVYAYGATSAPSTGSPPGTPPGPAPACPPPASAGPVPFDPGTILGEQSPVAPPAFTGDTTVAAPDPFWESLTHQVHSILDGANAIAKALDSDPVNAASLIQQLWQAATTGAEDKGAQALLDDLHHLQANLGSTDAQALEDALKARADIRAFDVFKNAGAVLEFANKALAVLTPLTFSKLFGELAPAFGFSKETGEVFGAFTGLGIGAYLILVGCAACDLIIGGIALGLWLHDNLPPEFQHWLADRAIEALKFLFPGFGFWIDPSGNVLTTAGAPVPGATVNLLSGASPTGPFSPVPAGSGLLMPGLNPETTDAAGSFRWDVVPGYYEVSTSAAGCASPGNPAQPTVTTPVLTIPPPAVGLVLTLACPGLAGPAPPTVSGLSLTRGPSAGGQVIAVNGTGFTPGSTVLFGTLPASRVTFISPSALEVVNPAGSGTVDVRVTSGGGSSSPVPAGQFTYITVPAIAAVSPNSGPLSGGTLVDLTGSGFTAAATVFFGGQPSPFVQFISAGELKAMSPSLAAGTVDITVTTEGGSSPLAAVDHFTFRPAMASPILQTTPSPATSTVGGVLKDTATLTGGFSPGGSVTFNLFGPDDPACSKTPAYSETDALTGGSAATGAGFRSNAAGTWHWTAIYAGDAGNLPASSDCAAEPVTVNRATPILTSAPVPATVVVGGLLNDTATLSGGFQPGGTVTFNLFAPGDSTCSTPVGTETDILASGAAGTVNRFASTAAGAWQWTASYSGDGNNTPVPPVCGTEMVTVSKATPTLATAPSPAGTIVGGPLKDSGTLPGSYSPTGSITFKLFGPADQACSGAPTYVEADPVTTAGAATAAAFSTNAAGTWHWTASYPGDANNNPAASGCAAEPVTVAKATPTLTTMATAQVFLNQPINDVAQLAEGFNPSGRIDFQLFGPADTVCATPLVPTPASAAVTGTGDFSSGSYTPAQVGRYRWIASYSGDANNNPVSTNCGDPGETSLVLRQSYITDGELCTFDVDPTRPGQQLALGFSPRVRGTYKLTSSNPAQVFYNTFDYGSSLGGTTLTITLPYPWVTRGKVAIDIYDSLETTTEDGHVCLEPGDRIGTSSAQVALSSYPGRFGTTASLAVVMPQRPHLAFAFVRVRLEYGLKGETGCTKGATSNDAACTTPVAVKIPDLMTYAFSDTAFNLAVVESENRFQSPEESGDQRNLG